MKRMVKSSEEIWVHGDEYPDMYAEIVKTDKGYKSIIHDEYCILTLTESGDFLASPPDCDVWYFDNLNECKQETIGCMDYMYEMQELHDAAWGYDRDEEW